MRRYRDLLATRGVGRFVAGNTLARLSVSMLSLSVLVAVAREHGYAKAGLAMTVYAATNAIASPIRGRLADRRSARAVLLALLAVHVPAFAVLPLVLTAPLAVLLPVCFLVGATVPPTGPVVRGLWPVLIPRDRLSAAYAFDSALNNATFVAGPAIAGALLLALPAPVAIAVTAVVKITGDLMVATAPGLSAKAPRTGGGRGPLRHGRVRLLLVAMALDTCAFAAMEVAAVVAVGGQGSAGALTAVLALGAVIGGLGYGMRTWPPELVALLTAAGVVVLAIGAATTGAVLLAVVYGVFGLVNGPVETWKQETLGASTPEDERVEAFAWVFTVSWLGVGFGAVLAGALASTGALLVAVVAQVIALALLAPLRGGDGTCVGIANCSPSRASPG